MRTATLVLWLFAATGLGCACSNARTGLLQTGTTAGSGDADATVADPADASGDLVGPEAIVVDASLPDAPLVDVPLADVPLADVAPVDATAGDATAADAPMPICCGAAAACPEGYTCGGGDKGQGTCKSAPASGKCWSAANCPKGVACVGASQCPCNALCGQIDLPGQCQGGPVGCCAKDQDCGAGERCVGNGAGNSGVCKPVPAWGGCWDGNDCTPTQKCMGGAVCPCDADCDGPDAIGACQGEDSGCCTGAGNCPKGAQCQEFSGIGWSTCVAVPEPGRCWKNTDCPAGHACKGAAVCPCGNECDMGYAGPGVCTPPPGSGCTAIQPTWVAEICDAASLVVWTGSQCVATCPGCCGCEPFCDATFPSIAACQAACQ